MHTGQSGVGGNKPQSTPHPSYAHKNSMSSSPPSLPHSVPPLLCSLALSSTSAATFPSTIDINRLTVHWFFSFLSQSSCRKVANSPLKVSFWWYPQFPSTSEHKTALWSRSEWLMFWLCFGHQFGTSTSLQYPWASVTVAMDAACKEYICWSKIDVKSVNWNTMSGWME